MNRFRYFVVFVPAEGFAWWNLFTAHRPGYGHCFALQYDPRRDLWAMLEYRREGPMLLPLLDLEVEHLIAWIMQENIPCLEIDDMAPARRGGCIPFFYCVPMIKRAIGIRDRFVITPWQLACALRRHGAQDSFRQPEKDTDHGVVPQSPADESPEAVRADGPEPA